MHCAERLLTSSAASQSLGVVVHIVGLQVGTRTDVSGQFQFNNVPAGRQTLQFIMTGYHELERVIDVNTSTPHIQIALKTSVYRLETINVSDATGDLAEFEKTTDLALEDVEFQKKLGMTLADTLSDEVGISQRTMGRAAARPIVRGLGGDRLLILENGERTGDKSASSADHAVSIDPTTAEGVEITRGPGALIYGSSTLGGVVNVKRNDIPRVLPRTPDMHLTFQGESVNSGMDGDDGFPCAARALCGAVQMESATRFGYPDPLRNFGKYRSLQRQFFNRHLTHQRLGLYWSLRGQLPFRLRHSGFPGGAYQWC